MFKELIFCVLYLRIHCTSSEQATANRTVVIDGYTVDSTITSPATLPLGRTALLVCRVSGIPHGQNTTYQWTCPNQPCLQAGYAGRKINNNIIAINTTSTSDGGTYTCTVTAGGISTAQNFTITIEGGEVVHSYGRLIPHEGLISTASQLQPPDTASGDGRIQCTVNSGTANFSYTGNYVLNGTTATYTIPAGSLSNLTIEGRCGHTSLLLYHYLFTSESKNPNVNFSVSVQKEDFTANNISVHFLQNELKSIVRVIVGYDRLDLGLPMVGQYRNNVQHSTANFTSLVPGARYRITAWGATNGKFISLGPTVLEETTLPAVPSPPRALTIPRVFEDGIELNWLPPRVTNGDIQHYIIRYTPLNGTEQEINTTDNTNYYNLTGLERVQTYYNFIVKAVNLANTSAQSDSIESYSHNPASLSTPTTKSATSTAAAPTTTPISPTADPLVIYIGAGAGSLLLVLVVVLAVIICCVVAGHRRGKRSRSTEHTLTLHYHSTPAHEQQEEPQVQITPGNYDTGNEGIHNTRSTGINVLADKETFPSFTTGGLYAGVAVSVKPKPVVAPSEYQLPEIDKENNREGNKTVTNPESFYAQPDMTAKSNKKGKHVATADDEDPSMLYAEVDKSKTKKKGKEKKEEQPQGDLYAVVDKTSKKKGKEKKAKEKEPQDYIYAEVDKSKKKGKNNTTEGVSFVPQ